MAAILVTGGAGYIGSHTCKALAQAGFLPIAYDDLSTGFAWSVKWGPLIKGSIEDQALLEKVCLEKKPLAVLHFAALTDARKCHEHPLLYYRKNVSNTLLLLETVKKFQIPHFIFSSTCAVYGIHDQIPIEEDHPKNPVNVYGETKLIGEKMVESLASETNAHIAILRYFNAAGADPDGDLGESHAPATHLIPILIETALKKRESFTLYGNEHQTDDGTPIRDYIHVSDLAEAHVLALKHIIQKKQNLKLNLGTGQGYSVREVLSAFQSQFNLQLPVTIGPRNPADPPHLFAKSDQAQRVLNWKPRYSDLSTILETTWRWQTR